MDHDRVLIATDGSEQSIDAAAYACDLARRHDATLHAVFVMDTDPPGFRGAVDVETLRSELHAQGERAIDAITELAAEHGVELETAILEGQPFDEVLTYAEDNDVDAIVVGRRGRSANIRILLGSTTDSILRHSSVPVIVIPKRSG